MAADMWKSLIINLGDKISRPNINTWIKPSKLVVDNLESGLYTLIVRNDYAKNWVEKNALEDITALLKKENPQFKNLRVVVKKTEALTEDLPLLKIEKIDEIKEKPQVKTFRKDYTFETFIVGNNSRLAFAASQVVSEKPGEVYNPLFIYGGVGLGKTHLMQAIGNEITKKDPSKKVVYTSCESFTNDFISALKDKTIDEFKKKYRQADVLLIDDIQFLSNKEGTQEEFFHTFNILHQANRQIVITSDRVPKDIPDLEERLSSRFGWGMIADIQSPNYETRLAILEKKASEKGISLPNEVLSFIASEISSNVRELEGALIKISTTSQLEGVNPNKEYAKKILKELISKKTPAISSKQVLSATAKYFNIEMSDLIGKRRIKELVLPRQIAMYFMREHLNLTYPQIGEMFSGKDHTTVIHSVDKIIKLKKTDELINKAIQEIQANIQG